MQQYTNPTEKKPLGKRIVAELLSWLKELAIAAVIVLLVAAFLIQPVRVKGESMLDTLQDGEVMLVTKPEYLFGDPAFGDVVICHYPGRGLEYFVKRVMGLPGDVIEIRDNTVYRNGEALEEPYLTPERNDNGFDMAPFFLGEDEYFVVGDNRYNSHDSRDWKDDDPDMDVGPISKGMIVGHVRQVIWPLGSWRAVH